MMKFFKWKTFVVTSIICLLPILLGLFLWEQLPASIAIHFDIYGNADNYASKAFVVFALPVMMVIIQAICCVMNDIKANKYGERKKFETVTKWIIPIMSIVLQGITFSYSLRWNVDIRKSVAFIVGTIFLVIGNYLPKLDYIKDYDIDAEKARKINRFIGYETVLMGTIYYVSIFLPPVSTAVCLFLLIPYALVGLIYSILIVKKSK